MTKFKLLLPLQLLLLSGTFILIDCRQPHSHPDNDPYRHVEILDPAGNYRLEWVVDWESNRIHFNVTVNTRGYVLFGISKRNPGGVDAGESADLIIGGVDWLGRPYFSDRHSPQLSNIQASRVDASQDWELNIAQETRDQTFLSFSRLIDTCDPQDIPLNGDSVNLVWAYSDYDFSPLDDNRFAASGAVPMYLLDPDLTPRAIQERRFDDPSTLPLDKDVKIWRLRSNLKVPPKRTTYWCTIHKLELPRKHHIIGMTVKTNNESRSNMHHSIFYRCTAPNAAALLDKYVNHPGEECYSQDTHMGEIPLQSCVETKGGGAIGGRSIFLPDSMGLPLGATGLAEYYLWQTHYDNPTRRTDLQVQVELDFYYTSKLRPNDGGVLSLGHHYPGSPSVLIPPGQTDHRIYGSCSSNCTRKLLPPEGIKLTAAILHSHFQARRVLIQHFRNGRELPPILNDDNYRFAFQPNRLLHEDVTILPGDQISTRCYYDTTRLNRTSIGGYGTDQEMCLTFGFYYNLIPTFPGICRSELISPEYNARYLGGVTGITWDQPRLEWAATAPKHLAGLTLSEISDSRYVNWTVSQIGRLQRDHMTHPQVDICPTYEEYNVQLRTGLPPSALTFVTYPWEAVEYKERNRCSLQ